MSDHKKVNTKEVYEKNYILYEVLEKSTSLKNKDILNELTKQYKEDNNIEIISDKDPYYEFLKKNNKKFEKIK